MLKVLSGIGVLDVQVAVVGQKLLDGHAPGAFVLLAIIPPGDAVGEFFVLQRLCLGIAVAALGQRQFVVPHLARARRVGVGSARLEEQQIGGMLV